MARSRRPRKRPSPSTTRPRDVDVTRQSLAIDHLVRRVGVSDAEAIRRIKRLDTNEPADPVARASRRERNKSIVESTAVSHRRRKREWGPVPTADAVSAPTDGEAAKKLREAVLPGARLHPGWSDDDDVLILRRLLAGARGHTGWAESEEASFRELPPPPLCEDCGANGVPEVNRLPWNVPGRWPHWHCVRCGIVRFWPSDLPARPVNPRTMAPRFFGWLCIDCLDSGSVADTTDEAALAERRRRNARIMDAAWLAEAEDAPFDDPEFRDWLRRYRGRQR